MAGRAVFPLPVREQLKPRFGEVSSDILTDLLSNLNKRNQLHLENLSDLCGCLKDSRLVERVFGLCEELRLSAAVGYQAVEILERFMARYAEDLMRSQKAEGSEELVFQTLEQKLFLSVLSSVQIASKLDLFSSVLNNELAVRFLQAAGHSFTKEQLLDSEILVLKTLQFNLSVPNPLTYVETLLEVLGRNEARVPVAQLHPVCVCVLRLVYLQRDSIYRALLVSATGRSSPSHEQRARFVSVSEDLMLLGVGVIAVASFIHHVSAWEKVVEELTGITGISGHSIMEFAHVTLTHITTNRSQIRAGGHRRPLL